MKLKKFLVCFGIATALLVSSSQSVNAITADLNYTNSDKDTTYGTTGTLTASSKFTVDVPLNPIATDTVVSKGSSNSTFKKSSTASKRTFVSHTINAKIGGIGFGSISSSSGVELSSSGSSAKYSCSTYNWNYKIYSDILALYSYRETHSVSYVLKKSSGAKTTVSLSTQLKYN